MWNRTRSVLLLLAAACVFYACNQETGTGQQNYVVAQERYTLVADLAQAVMLMPEAGDQIIANDTNLYDSRFYAAIDDRINFFHARAANHYEYCNEYHPEPQANQRCYQENEPAKNRDFLQVLRSATRNDILWSESLVAQASVVAKQLLGEDTWVSLINASFAKTRHLFIVE